MEKKRSISLQQWQSAQAIIFGKSNVAKQFSSVKLNINIVIPVYNNSADTMALLDSLQSLKFESGYKLVVVNDCSTDLDLTEFLRAESENSNAYELVENSKRKGFGASINRGMNSVVGDAIWLNTDTIVAPSSVFNNLAVHLRNNPNIATVTPVTNSGFLASLVDQFTGFPTPNKKMVRKFNQCLSHLGLIEIPTGVGFAMAVNAEVFKKCGGLSETRLGYGEETDFCLKATKLGFQNMLALNTFVGHHGGASFKGEGQRLIREASFEILKQHPSYLESLEEFLESAPNKAYGAVLLWNNADAFQATISDKSLHFQYKEFCISCGIDLQLSKYLMDQIHNN